MGALIYKPLRLVPNTDTYFWFYHPQVAPVLMTASLLERMRDNYMVVEVWDKKVDIQIF